MLKFKTENTPLKRKRFYCTSIRNYLPVVQTYIELVNMPEDFSLLVCLLSGRCCGPSSRRDHYERELSGEDDNTMMNEEDEALLSTVDSVSMPVAVEIPDSVCCWLFPICSV